MLTRLADITTARRIVVKIGSALLVGNGQARESWLVRASPPPKCF
jgi:glutamate 5-kinase